MKADSRDADPHHQHQQRRRSPRCGNRVDGAAQPAGRILVSGGRGNRRLALNDIKGQHVTTQDALDALNSARAVPEGNVGGGTGMNCNGFKGGTGTSSRKLELRKAAATQWACWCNATMAARTSFVWPGSRWRGK